MLISPALGGSRPATGFDLPFLSLGRAACPLLEPLEADTHLPADALQHGQLYRVTEGCLALYHQLDPARRQILDILGPGRIVERSILDRLRCEAMAVAPTCLEKIEDAPFALKTLAAENQELMLSRAFGHLTRIGKQGASERVAAALLDLSKQFAPGGTHEASLGFPLHLSRSDLADWLGLTLETVSRCLSRFKRDGLVAFGKAPLMILTDRRALQEIARGERTVESIYKPMGEAAPKGMAASSGL